MPFPKSTRNRSHHELIEQKFRLATYSLNMKRKLKMLITHDEVHINKSFLLI